MSNRRKITTVLLQWAEINSGSQKTPISREDDYCIENIAKFLVPGGGIYSPYFQGHRENTTNCSKEQY